MTDIVTEESAGPAEGRERHYVDGRNCGISERNREVRRKFPFGALEFTFNHVE